MQLKNMSKEERRKNLILIVISAALLAALIFVTVKYTPYILSKIKSLDEFRNYLLSFKWASVFIYMLFQALQVAIAVIPGEPVQLAGGYVFGTFLGGVYTTVGMMAGSLIAFYLARIIGMPVIRIFVPKKQLEKFEFLINSNKGETAMFLIFLIPGIPKDVMLYIAGISPVKPLKFFMLYMIARLPGNFGMAYIGANMQSKNYTGAIIMSVIAALAFLAGVIFKDKILDALHKVLHKEKS